jgi:hypothetical protein
MGKAVTTSSSGVISVTGSTSGSIDCGGTYLSCEKLTVSTALSGTKLYEVVGGSFSSGTGLKCDSKRNSGSSKAITPAAEADSTVTLRAAAASSYSSGVQVTPDCVITAVESSDCGEDEPVVGQDDDGHDDGHDHLDGGATATAGVAAGVLLMAASVAGLVILN